jgi:4-amino-4-deoxy-L-arabinose transferase-like glycosyltransferase
VTTETAQAPGTTIALPTTWRARDDGHAIARWLVAHAPELLLLGGAAVLFLWNLGASSWANAYYSAAALAGSQSWEAFLFGSFDAGNAITVDKTPAALWVMSLSVRLFGLSGWSLLVPQALMGVASVGLLYATVRRTASRLAGLIAGAVLALTPVAALMFRFNNPDALLVLLLIGAAYATTRALEHGSARWLVLAGTIIGFGFLAKMLQAFLVIPAFTLVYLVAAPVALPRRVLQVGAAAVAVIVSAGWFVALVELWPAASRPFVGGSQTNSIIELLLGYNGLGRITGDEVGRIGAGTAGPFSDGNGILRLFQGELSTEVAWLLPAALIALVAVFVARRAAPRTDALRAQALIWGGWLVVTGLVFSLMQGIFHEYYTIALAPAIGALVGIGVSLAWRHRGRFSVAVLAGSAVLFSAWWAVEILALSPAWNTWLTPVLIAAGLFAFLAILLAASARDLRIPAIGLAASLAVLLLAPGLGAVATAASVYTGALPTAEPQATAIDGARFGGPGGFTGRLRNGGGQFPNGGGFVPRQGGQGPFTGQGPGTQPGNGFTPGQIGGNGGPGFIRNGAGGGIGGLLDAAQADPALVAALQQDASRYTWTAATTGTHNAAGLALSSQTSVMAIGGFNGSDPSPTLAQFQQDVADGKIHWYVSTQDAAGFRGQQGGSDIAGEIAAWVRATFKAQTIGGVTVYDLSSTAAV